MSQHVKAIEMYSFGTQHLDQDASAVLATPELARECLGQYAFVSLAREYISLFDSTTKTIYLYYLMGKSPVEISQLVGTTSGQAVRARYSLIYGFSQYMIERLNAEGVDIEQAEKYVDCMRLNSKMDDDQIAEAFEEDMLTTKIMKHFVRRAGMVNSSLL